MSHAEQRADLIADNPPFPTDARTGADRLSLVAPNRPVRLGDAVITRDDRLGRAIRRYLEHYEQRIFASGVRLELSTDFALLADINPHLDKVPLTPQFDPAVSDIGPVNGFWLKGTDVRGEVVMTHATRFDDLSDTTLALHYQSLRAFYADPAETAHPDEECRVNAPAAHTITGRTCYQGELWIKKSSGFRGHDLAHDTPRVSFAIAMARWMPDVIYGTVNPGIAEKGLASRYGYRNAQPEGMCWNNPRTREVLDEWLIWMTRRDLLEIIEEDSGCDL